MITLEIIQAAGAVCDGQQRFSGWEFGGDRCVRRVQVLPESGAMWRLSRKGATQSHSPEATLEIGVSVVSKHIRATYRESPNPVPATQSSRGVKASKAAASKRPSGDPTESHQVVRLPRKAAAASKRPNHRGVQRRPRRQSRQRASDRLSGCRAVDRDKLI